MTDLNPCPSCREPMDHPSGDGCANMTAHKERAMTDEELIARLRDTTIFGTQTATEAADRIEALTAKLTEAVERLTKLEKSASEVSRYGAATGPQWVKMSIDILAARATLAALAAFLET